MPPKTRLVRKPSKALDSYLKAGQRAGRLLPSLEQHMLTKDPEYRRQDILHPSSMAKSDWCPAAGYFQLLRADDGGTGVTTRNALQRQNIFDEGHYIHAKWQDRFWDQGILYGKWQCIKCNHTWWATAPQFCRDLTCQAPTKFLRYREVPLESPPEYRIGGHSDGWTKDSHGDCMIEIKSVGKGTYRFDAPKMVERYGEDADELWKNLKRPFASHVRQLQIYLHLANLHWRYAPLVGVFIYESKTNQQYKEFVIEYDPAETAELFAQAAEIVDRLNRGHDAPDCVRGEGRSCPECSPYREQK